MIRHLKMLGMAVLAVAALGALVASSASAISFHSESETTKLTARAEGHHVFDAAGNSITCEEANFDATTTSKTAETITFTPDSTAPGGAGYQKCSFFGTPVTVNMNNCDYVFHASGTVDIGGTNCTFITFRAEVFGIPCDVKVGPQTGLGTATYHNIGTGSTREVTMEPNITGITYTQEGAGCGSHNEGRYTTGNTTVTAVTDGTSTHTGIWVE